jgi:YD repeat-containing protein
VEIRYEAPWEGNPAPSGENLTESSITTFEYDAGGRMTVETEERVSVYTITDGDGTILSVSEDLQTYRNTWTWNTAGQLAGLIQEEWFSDDWHVWSTKQFVWEDDLLLSIQREDGLSEFSYDADGRIEMFTTFTIVGETVAPESRQLYTFTEQGASCFYEEFTEFGYEWGPLSLDLLIYYGRGEVNRFAD